MEWVRQMNACKAQAEEIVKAELIYDWVRKSGQKTVRTFLISHKSWGRIVHKVYGIIWIWKLSNKSGFIEVFRMKQKVPMICNIVSLILLIVFVIKSIVDYTQYSTSLNSAPFYLWVLVNALFLVIPAIILFVIGFVVKKKQ